MKLVAAKTYKKQIKALYKSAFPKEERAPLLLLYYWEKRRKGTFYAILGEDGFAGLVYIIRRERVVYLFFLAIEESQRGRGYGSAVLSLVRQMYPDSVVTLMIEDTADTAAENYAERIRRLRFYETNGFVQLHVKLNEAGVDYELLGTEKTVTQADFLAMMKWFFGKKLFQFLYRKTEVESR